MYSAVLLLKLAFDCSGFVCYALNHSGVYSIGRTTAQGLYDACTPVDRFDAKPGDLVFSLVLMIALILYPM